MNFEICIGKAWNMELKLDGPAKVLKISEDQKNILLLFAEKRIDKNCNPIYKIGECEFTITLSFDYENPYYMQKEKTPPES
jgi:hypothetical protein